MLFRSHNAVKIQADYRLNIPIQTIDSALGGVSGDNLCFENNLATNNSTPNNGQNIFFPSYIFKPGNYVPYTTSKLTYYSRLDDTITIPSPPVFVSDPLINYVNVGNNNGVNDITSKINNGFYLGQGSLNNDGKILDRKSTRLTPVTATSRMPSSA